MAVFEVTSLNVTWAIPQSDVPITQYQVQYRTDETWSSAPLLSGSPPPSSTVLNGMQAGYEYKVRVRALSVVGAGEWSSEQTQRIGSTFVHCNLPDALHSDSIYTAHSIHTNQYVYLIKPIPYYITSCG